MSEHTPTIKRRRLDAAASTLSKPFKSPLRARAEKTDETVETQQSSTDYSHSPKKPDQKKDGNENSTIPTNPQAPTPRTPRPKASTPILKRKPNPTTPSQPTDPHLATLQSEHTHLLTRLAVLKQDLDTARQALKIEEKKKGEELEGLIGKWKGAGRLAAEELYVGARQRVDRMGGVGAWREREREGKKRREDWNGGGGGGKGVEEGEREDGEDKVEEEEESFTMDMMLKSLNIELGIIGFDKDNQRWVD